MSFALETMCAGNAEALTLLCTLYGYFHQIDDFVDRDKERSLEDILQVQLAMMHALSFNPFWQAQKSLLWPVVHSGVLAYWESEQLRARNAPGDSVVGHVLKSQYQEIAFLVAFLVGGPEHEFSCRKRFRYVDFDR